MGGTCWHARVFEGPESSEGPCPGARPDMHLQGQSPLRGRVPALYGRSRQEALDIKGCPLVDGGAFDRTDPCHYTVPPKQLQEQTSALSWKPTQSARVSVGGSDPPNQTLGNTGLREGGTLLPVNGPLHRARSSY